MSDRISDEQLAEWQRWAATEAADDARLESYGLTTRRKHAELAAALAELAERRADAAKQSRLNSGRRLTEAEITRCIADDITIGYDIDDEGLCPIQHTHLCVVEPSDEVPHALCRTPHLWGAGVQPGGLRADGVTRVEDDDWISCTGCLEVLALAAEVAREKARAEGTLVARIDRHLASKTCDLLEKIDQLAADLAAAKARADGAEGRVAELERMHPDIGAVGYACGREDADDALRADIARLSGEVAEAKRLAELRREDRDEAFRYRDLSILERDAATAERDRLAGEVADHAAFWDLVRGALVGEGVDMLRTRAECVEALHGLVSQRDKLVAELDRALAHGLSDEEQWRALKDILAMDVVKHPREMVARVASLAAEVADLRSTVESGAGVAMTTPPTTARPAHG